MEDFLETHERNPHLSLEEKLRYHYGCDGIVLIFNENKELEELLDELDGVDVKVLK